MKNCHTNPPYADSSSVKAGSVKAGWYRAPGWPAAARQK
jgi:hypothetical protein